MSKKGDILIAAPSRWDEACFSAPAVRALAASGLSLGILCQEEQKSFWKTLGTLEIITYPPKAGTKLMAAGIAGKWEASLAWEAGPPAEACAKAAIPRRLGVEDQSLGKLLNHPLSITRDPLAHRVQFYLSIAKELGVETERPEFFDPAPLRVAQVGDAVLVCPDSDFGANHEWPLDRWEEVAAVLTTKGLQITIANLTSGRNLGRALAARLGGDIPILESKNPGADLNLFAAYPFLIAADGYLPHLASHMGTTCATLFGPNDPAWKRPLGKRHLIIRRHVECAPCLLEKCPIDLRCQNELTTERMLAILFP